MVVTADVIGGRFALCDPIGSGGSGTVWRAYDRKLQRYCAAKLLRQRDAGDLLRFVREQSVRLDHPHIVSPYSWVAEDGTVLIASELMTGGSLHTLIGDYGPLAEETVTAVLKQVLSGLRAVHDAQLIHRDVKPANLLLGATGAASLHVVLTDFGLTISRLDARLTQVGMVIGTPGYLPPEVLRGGAQPDPSHDLFAVGRLALTMIAGAESVGSGADMVASIKDTCLRRTVGALLRDDPEERPADARTAADLLDGTLSQNAPRTRDGEPIEVLDQLPELPPGWGPRGPAEAAAAVPARAVPRATIIDVEVTAPREVADQPRPIGERSPDAPAATSVTARSTRRWGWLIVAATVVAGLVLAVRLLPGASGNPSETPPSTFAPPSVTQQTSTPPATPTAGPTVSAILETVQAGTGCTWQQEGDRRADIEGVALVCTLADGTYQWRLPG